MKLEDLMRRACKWLFLKLQKDLSLRKVFRTGYFYDEMQVLNTCRNIYVEASVEHELGNFKLICEKIYLTEEEEEKNEEVREENKVIEEENARIDKENKEKNEKKSKKAKKEIPFKRGDKEYNLIGLVDDEFKGKDLAPKDIYARLYHFFDNLKRFYSVLPDETKPALLSMNVIGEKEEDLDEYAEKTKVHYIDPTPIMPFLFDFRRYLDEEDEARKEAEKMETEARKEGS